MSTLISIEDLQIDHENRFRKVLVKKDIELLQESIVERGLMQAVVVESDGKTLIAGYRRTTAIMNIYEDNGTIIYNGEEIPQGTIPVVSMKELSEIEIKRSELHENTRRVQLTWQERASAEKEIHELLSKEAEARGDESIHTKEDTIKTIYEEKAQDHSVRDLEINLIIAKHLDNEEVANAKSRNEALKIIERNYNIIHRRMMGENINIEDIKSSHNLMQADLVEALPKLKSQQFDCIIADPPYGIDANKFANMTARKHSYVDSESYSNAVIEIIASEGFRVTKHMAHVYLFCDFNRFDHCKKIFTEVGWKVFRTPLIWYKGAGIGITPWPNIGPRRTYETIMFAVKGDRQSIIPFGRPDVICAAHEKNIDYAAHKPVTLYEELISRTCNPGDKVLDPCCGSGPVFTAATNNSVTATGMDIDAEAIGFCVERLKS